MDRVPPEVLSHIFQCLVEASDQFSKTILNLIYVCKSWARLGEELLYKDIRIGTFHQLQALQKRFSDHSMNPASSEGPSQQPVGHLVRFVGIDDFAPEAIIRVSEKSPTMVNASDRLAAILRHLPNLEHYHSTLRRGHNSTEVDVIAQVCSATLLSLGLMVNVGDHGVLLAVNMLQNLRALSLSFRPDNREWPHDAQSPLALPRVQDVHWTIYGSITLGMIHYLISCKFGLDCSLDLTMPRVSAEHAAIMLPYLSQPRFQSITLNGFSEQAQVVLAPIMGQVEELRLSTRDLSHAIAQYGKLPASLHLEYYISGRDGTDDIFWSFLRQLHHTARADATPCILHIHWSEYQPSWFGAEDDVEYDRFVKRLIPVATELSKRNITVTDGNGVNYTSLLTTKH